MYEKKSGRCGEVAVSIALTVVSILSRRNREEIPCLHEASKEQFRFPAHARGIFPYKNDGSARRTFLRLKKRS